MNEERDNFGELTFNALTALTALMNCDEVSKNDKAVVKLNRFKNWIKQYADEVDSSK